MSRFVLTYPSYIDPHNTPAAAATDTPEYNHPICTHSWSRAVRAAHDVCRYSCYRNIPDLDLPAIIAMFHVCRTCPGARGRTCLFSVLYFTCLGRVYPIFLSIYWDSLVVAELAEEERICVRQQFAKLAGFVLFAAVVH